MTVGIGCTRFGRALASHPPPFWTLFDVEASYERWLDVDAPAAELRAHVLDWLFTRQETPHLGLRRDPENLNMWFGAVPGTSGDGQVLTATLLIFEELRRVRLLFLAFLSEPI